MKQPAKEKTIVWQQFDFKYIYMCVSEAEMIKITIYNLN